MSNRDDVLAELQAEFPPVVAGPFAHLTDEEVDALVAEDRAAGRLFGRSTEAPAAQVLESASGKDASDRLAAGHELDEHGPQELKQGQLSSVPLGRRMAAEMLRARYIFVPRIGWHRWDGCRWKEATADAVIAEAATWAERFIVGLITSGAPDELVRKSLRYREIGAVGQLVAGAKTAGSMVLVDADRLDAHEDLLNCANGVLDLTTGVLGPHDPDLLLTKVTSVGYIPGATHPDWTTALEAFADDEVRAWSQQYLGTGCVGRMPAEDVATLWHGGGSNGKSSILGGAEASLGDYAMPLSKTLLGGKRDEHPTQMMDLRGLRLGFMEETAEGHRLDTVKLKEIVGTEMIKGRRMGENYTHFPATHTLVITSNYRPAVTDTDHGTWRRLRLVPFPHTYGGDGGLPVDRGLRGRLKTGKAQREAALAWLVEGAMAWYRAGRELPPDPEVVVNATREWRVSCDLIFAFVDDHLVAEQGAEIEVELLRTQFNEWLPRPHQPWGRQTFAERFTDHPALREMGAVRGKDRHTRRAVIIGARLLLPGEQRLPESGVECGESGQPEGPEGPVSKVSKGIALAGPTGESFRPFTYVADEPLCDPDGHRMRGAA